MSELPLGTAVDPTPRPFPQRRVHQGGSVTLEPLTDAHVDQLWQAKGFQRDVAWHSMLASEWPAHRAALEAWLADGNFGGDGTPMARVAELRRPQLCPHGGAWPL